MNRSNNILNAKLAWSTARQSIVVALVCMLVGVSGCDVWTSPDTRVERAREHMEKGHIRPAMVELKKALQSNPEHAAARLELAELSMWLGDHQAADNELDRAIRAGARGHDVNALRYEIMLAQGRFDDLLQELARDDSTPPTKRLLLEARAASFQGHLELAKQKVTEALEMSPQDPEALYESARVASAEGDFDAALDLPDRLSGDQRMQARAWFLRGLVLIESGRHRAALEALNEARKLSGQLRATEQLSLAAAQAEANLALNDIAGAERSLAAVTRWGEGTSAAHYLRARIAMLKSDYPLAVSECQRALRAQPDHTPAQILMAAAHLAQGSTEQAQDVLTRVLASRPNNLAARKLLAQVHLSRNQLSEAQRVLESGTESDADVDWLLGAALLRAGNTDEALEHLQRGMGDGGDDLRRLHLAGAYISAGKPDKASYILARLPANSPVAARAKLLQVLATAADKAPAQARLEIENLVADHETDALLASAAGAYLAARGDVSGARRLLERAVSLEPTLIEPRLALARLEAQSGNIAVAQKQLTEIVRIEPQRELARLGLAELAWRTGDRAGARKWLEEAVSADPTTIEARLRLAQIAFIEADPKRARSLLNQALNVAKDRKRVMTATARVLARAGLNDDAVARYREAIAAGDTSASLELARLHVELEDPSKARVVLEAGLKSHPDWREAQQLLAFVEARDGNIPRALELAKVLARESSPPALSILEGDIWAIAGDTEKALQAYEAAQRQHATAPVAVKIFRIKREASAASAEKVLLDWLERHPDDAQVRRVLALHYDSTGASEQAIKQYEWLLAADRIEPAMLNNLAWALHEKGDPRAVELAERAYAASPHFPEIADTYGWVLVQMGKVAQALDVLENALASAPRNPDIQYHLAAAYAKSGDNARALELLHEALQSPNFASRRAAEQLLQAIGETG